MGAGRFEAYDARVVLRDSRLSGAHFLRRVMCDVDRWPFWHSYLSTYVHEATATATTADVCTTWPDLWRNNDLSLSPSLSLYGQWP